MKKKALKLSLETVRHLEGVTGGVYNPSIGPLCAETLPSRGVIGCTFGPQKPRPRSLGPSCGIVCF